ncbi:putative M18 family aminopeptidase 1 [Sporotomaculum syntrophicum]|uniref:M18 family aminopeptidase n=1 Tax=Sporotomaculum syntrophicum TaxID=182264 RepID=A0A9D2WQW3_9FIRM|nr:aminopeptidase [Sporotomaculum syntrophicum]KAF1085920.1 putative M18 family aminopeptidase 1 [Sporotomaculum syntrophicum]
MTEKSRFAYSKKIVWDYLNNQEKEEVFHIGEDYKRYIKMAKTERETIKITKEFAENNGYEPIEKITGPLQPGTRIYQEVKGKAIVMVTIGNSPLTEGVNIIGAHVDSPRLDLKVSPLYENNNLALIKTHYYGGIKKYHWLSLPLALHGVIIRSDGIKINICLGEDDSDPVFTITDLLPHLAKDQLDKKVSDAFPGESLNALCGSLPIKDNHITDRVKEFVLELLNKHYGIIEEDLFSAELELVPALSPRDVGLDRALVGAYGQDDRVCAYGLLKAMVGVERPVNTAVAVFADKEEIGSAGNTGMQSSFFLDFMAELLEKSTGNYNELLLRRSMRLSRALSADVNAAIDPNFEEVMEKNNATRLGSGLTITKYTGSGGKKNANDAHAEYLARVRKILNDHNVIWQTGELGKVDQGGGGTIAYMLANLGIDVVDCGVALLGMHSPYEICHKADIYMMYKGYQAFFNS